MSNTSDIFIQIAAYRDPELQMTLRHAIDHATDASRLHFCVAWQHAHEDANEDDVFGYIVASDAKLTVLDIPHMDSKGVCWARHNIQHKYAGERYTLQLDSHHRFVEDWDSICVEMLEDLIATGVEKPILTAYLPSYNPEDDPDARVSDPWFMVFDRFIPEGVVFFLPAPIEGWQKLSHPLRARFYSGHFAFTLGSFAIEVQHDPEFYFHGEEISIAARAYTHGYDLYHPHRLIAWHEFTREGRSKHWDDHKTWGIANASCHDRNRMLFGMDEYVDQPEVVAQVQNGKYGFGTKRTLEDYERYTGICFRKRSITQSVIDKNEPFLSDNLDVSYLDFEDSCIRNFKHCIDIYHESVTLDDYDFWVVEFRDAAGKAIFRKDADEHEIADMMKDSGGYCKIWREFHTEVHPASWIVWPHSKEHDWCEQIIGTLNGARDLGTHTN